MELTREQMVAYLRDELELGKVSSVYEPDGIFSSIDEKQQIIEWLYEKNSIRNQ